MQSSPTHSETHSFHRIYAAFGSAPSRELAFVFCHQHRGSPMPQDMCLVLMEQNWNVNCRRDDREMYSKGSRFQGWLFGKRTPSGCVVTNKTRRKKAFLDPQTSNLLALPPTRQAARVRIGRLGRYKARWLLKRAWCCGLSFLHRSARVSVLLSEETGDGALPLSRTGHRFLMSRGERFLRHLVATFP